MKNFFKRFKLSEWLLLVQIVLSALTLFLTTVLGDSIVDIVGLVGNIVNGIALLVVFSLENARNIKYYELTGQFIFNKLGENFSSFMDFLMSEEYKKMPFDEHNVLQDKLQEVARTGDYEVKRKISRALPYLHEVDSKMTLSLIEILRSDICNDSTDIRRRTLEAMHNIIQKEPRKSKQIKLARKFERFFHYHQYDDSFTIVACIEYFYFLHDYIFISDADKVHCRANFEKLKQSTRRAYDAQIGTVSADLCEDMENIWSTLCSLSVMRDVTREDYCEKRRFIEQILSTGGQFSKLTVVKNLFYTCKNYPTCLLDKKCTASGSRYMMEKINHFLANALDQNVYLAMPTVRYFDCVCNNIHRTESKDAAQNIMRGYYCSDVLLIAQTAFDKFGKLLELDPLFAKEILADLLEEEQQQADDQSQQILEQIEALPPQRKDYFLAKPGRMKFKIQGTQTRKQRTVRSGFDDVKEIDQMIMDYQDRIRFIGKIKKYKEDHKL